PTRSAPEAAAHRCGPRMSPGWFAYLLYFRLIADVGPARALTVTFLIPLFGVLWGVLFLGEPVAIGMLSGCALILAGTWLAPRTARAGARTALTHPRAAANAC